MASPFETAREWDGYLRPIEFPVPMPLLPSSTVTFLHYAGVPKRFEVLTHETIRFDFLASAARLATQWASQMADYSFPVGWGGLWRFGDITYTQASAWLCIEELTGRVFAVDVDIDNPLQVVNGSVEGMVRCMRVLYDWSRQSGNSLASAGPLIDALARDEGLSTGEAGHFWIPLVEAAAESGCDQLGAVFE